MNFKLGSQTLFLACVGNLESWSRLPCAEFRPIALWLQILQAAVVTDERPTSEGGSSGVWSSYVVPITKHVHYYINNKSRGSGLNAHALGTSLTLTEFLVGKPEGKRPDG